MGFFKPTAFGIGLAKGGLDLFDKAEKASEEGLENLKIARDEVNEEIKGMSDNYNKAIQIGDKVGGGAFAKYLFNTQDISYLAGLVNQTQKVQNEELSSLKNNFENLSENDKARFSDGDFSEDVKTKFDSDVESLKVKKGLVNTNNMGEATANTLAGKVQTMVDRSFEPRREDIMSSVIGGELRKSEPLEGGFDSLQVLSSVKPFLSLNYQDAQTYNEKYLSWFDNTYRDRLTGLLRDPEAVQDRLEESLVRAGYEIMSPDNPNRLDDRVNENGLTKLDVILESIAANENTTREGAIEEIIRESYFDQYYGVGSYGDGYLAIKRKQKQSSGGNTVTQTPITVAEDFEDMSLEDQIAETRRVLIDNHGTEASEELSDEDIVQIINNSIALQ